MRYNWDLDELKTNRTILEEVLKKFDDEETKNNIKKDINLYQNMIKLANKNGKGIDIFDDDYQELNASDIIKQLLLSYNQNNIKYWDIVLNSYFTINNYNFNGNDVYRKLHASNDTLVDITVDFFKEMTTPNLLNKFKSTLKEGTKIQINYEKTDGKDGGLTLFDDALHNKYIYIARRNELLDIVLLPHESFHYLFMGDNNGIISKYNTFYLNEVEGMLANILFTDYANKIGTNYTEYFKNYFKKNYQLYVYEVLVRYAIIQSITKKGKIKFNKLNQFLDTTCQQTRHFNNIDEFIPYITTPQDLTLNYTLSNLVAIDLYYKYLIDREEAFYNLESIRSYKQTNQVFTLLENNGITFMKDDYANLKKYIKK